VEEQAAPEAAWRVTIGAPVRWFRRLASQTQDRLIGVALAGPSLTVLGLAAWLTPDPNGVGTHQQLGLGGCTILTMFGVPCPMCGMTTTFTHLAHFHALEGALNQPFGVVLFLSTVAAAALGLADIVRPGGRWRRALAIVERHETAIAIGLLFGMIGGWGWKWAAMSGALPFLP
jgi:hypothetical protein